MSSRGAFGWAAVALLVVAPVSAYARDWWVIEPDKTCQSPHVYSSPADQIKTLTREGEAVHVKKAKFPDGSFALEVDFPSGRNLWVSSQQTCNFILAVIAPSEPDADWDDFQ